MRRAAALVVVLVAGFGLVRVVGSITAGSEGVADADGSEVIDGAPVTVDDAPTTDSPESNATVAANTVPVEPESTGPPSPDNPSKVFI
ncbi:MAG TPA: hypothetical protein VES40_20315, partial [Ilumatobacteraceae bacterium]|nr:hypothetical protein [Ilumatobacteraceae bacterium]